MKTTRTKSPKVCVCQRCLGCGTLADGTRYYQASGAFGRRKDGTPRSDKRTVRLSTEAEFWRCMALMKTGKAIKIPRRQFIGQSPEVEKAVREIIEENLSDYFAADYTLK